MSEALPAGTLQMYALLSASKVSKTAVARIATACCSIAFTSASISYDWDTSPTKRKENPNFYGYVKDSPGSRTVTFLCLFLLAFFHVASKFFAITLLTSISGVWAAFYLCGDMAVYLLYKAVRGDLRYWINVPTLLSTLTSVIIRPGLKTVVDSRASCSSGILTSWAASTGA